MPTDPNRFSTPAPPREADPFDGVLIVDKPTGPTSHDIVAQIRRTFRIKKVGHGGTLDPMATGLLLILLGRGTKLSAQFLGSDKTYEGTMHLGVQTNSLDADGEVTAEADPSGVTEEQVAEAMTSMLGDGFQTPPMVSAIKIDGVPLYKHARKGKEVKREPRFIHLYEFQITRFSLPHVDFRVICSKGTYVRTLCDDIGQTVGCGAHLSALRRTQSGKLTIDNGVTLDAVLAMSPDELARHIIPIRQFA